MSDKEYREIEAVHERDLPNLLSKFGVFEKFRAGEMKCKFCKEQVTSANIHSVLPEAGAVHFICDKPDCIINFSEYIVEKNKGSTNDS